ncbi:MAG: DNA repair protein RecN [Ruminobacter sp.]|nr:DNA repair protein RecN [Ruminobacter sp.]
MLETLSIENFAVAKKLSINFSKGLTAITGETGAGKSIAIDALSLILGGKTNAKFVRDGAKSCLICATFNISDSPKAKSYLCEKELLDNEDDNSCIIRRTITADGKSKAFINDINVNLTTLKELSPTLLSIHGQNESQLILVPENQLDYIDAYGELTPYSDEISQLFNLYKDKRSKLINLSNIHKNNKATHELEKYHIEELEELSPSEGDYSNVEAEHDKLNHAKTLLEKSSFLVNLLNDDSEGLKFGINEAIKKMSDITRIDKELNPLLSNLNTALINIEDTISELNSYISNIEINPERIEELSNRMSLYKDLSNKHNTNENDLHNVLNTLKESYASFEDDDKEILELKNEVEEIKVKFNQKAEELTQKRLEVIPAFASKIQEMLKTLSMPNVVFTIEHKSLDHATNQGKDEVIFKFSANLGLAPDEIKHTASGGEISRIALAILVLTANKISSPSMIFDEIDTGISGQTAATIGKMLRLLGNTSQVITVTHLPQVAASSHNHFEVSKTNIEQETISSITLLDDKGREQEIARLLAGDTISDTAIQNAKELIANQTK